MCNKNYCPHSSVHDKFVEDKLNLLNDWHDQINVWKSKVDTDLKWIIRWVVGLGSLSLVSQVIIKLLEGK